MIQIMKASAGSGKTFNLARKYITLLFRKNDRYAYRHILAVTFTNKATGEMKSRILMELHLLSVEPEKSGYLKYFMPERFTAGEMAGVDQDDIIKELPGRPGQEITIDSLKAVAGSILSNILHDYSAFAVSTIDRFFQQTLKSFSREIGQFASYQVELDKDSLVRESVDRILDSLSQDNPDLLKWLTDCALEQIERGERFNLESRLAEMAGRLKSDAHRNIVEKYGIDEGKAYSRENLNMIRRTCSSVIDAFEDRVKGRADTVLSVLDSAGVLPEHFNRKFLSKVRTYSDFRKGEAIYAPSVSFMSLASDSSRWFSKAAAPKYLPLVQGILEIPLEEFCSLFRDEFKVYNTARILKGQLYELGVAADLYREFNALIKEKNVLSIDDSNSILKDIIDGTDAPFIYEKIGVRFENFLLDEFQDTSVIQWDNFRPLIHNSDSQGFDNLIVGDVKQSIYRWRGSDWNLLDNRVITEFRDCRTTVLDSNFRSAGNIVTFNNRFFTFAARALDLDYGTGTCLKAISEIYSDVCQNAASRDKGDGIVDISFCGNGMQLETVLDLIDGLHGKGAGYGEIAVLVRDNSSGADIAGELVGNGIPVITDDSLKVKSSVVVRRLVSLLSYVDNPSDSVNGYLAMTLDVQIPSGSRSVADLCESLLRDLRKADPESFDAEVTYIQSFMDCMTDYVSAEGNSLHDFLGYWEGVDPAISSPAIDDAVRIMTVHKAKGLDFPYVIFPFAEKVNLFRPQKLWCRPELEGTTLEAVQHGVYDVLLSESSRDTLFCEDFLKEKKMQYIDNINIFYVALTRAAKGLFIVAAQPSKKFMESLDSQMPAFSDFRDILYRYVYETGSSSGFVPVEGENRRFRLGDFPDGCPAESRSVKEDLLPSCYPSFPLNPDPDPSGDVRERGRLKFSADSVDFFSDEGSSGVDASNRIKGVVLHDVLSRVMHPGDLRQAVDSVCGAGAMTEEQSEAAFILLEDRIKSAIPMGWFPEDRKKVRTEVTLIDADGRNFRPDRVVIDGDNVHIVDYKFGGHESRYEKQIMRYADLYRRMGYGNVTASLWYIMSQKVMSYTLVGGKMLSLQTVCL